MAVQNIGFPIDFTKGSFKNVEFLNNKLTIKKIGTTTHGDIYSEQGEWISEVIDLVDNYTSLENLAINSVVDLTKSIYKVYTRTSEKNVVWEDYRQIDSVTGKMMSTKNRYIQVKIEFIGKKESVVTIADEFDVDSNGNYEKNDYLIIDDNLKIRRDFNGAMDVDSAWNEDGHILRKFIPKKSQLKKIDKISVI